MTWTGRDVPPDDAVRMETAVRGLCRGRPGRVPAGPDAGLCDRRLVLGPPDDPLDDRGLRERVPDLLDRARDATLRRAHRLHGPRAGAAALRGPPVPGRPRPDRAGREAQRRASGPARRASRREGAPGMAGTGPPLLRRRRPALPLDSFIYGARRRRAYCQRWTRLRPTLAYAGARAPYRSRRASRRRVRLRRRL